MDAKSHRRELIGAAVLMAASSCGPGFLTQTAAFTGALGSSFGFAILISLIMSAIAQLNIWRVLCYSGLHAQELSNRLLKGLGFFLSALIVFGGLAFTVSNIGGGALGMNALFGVPDRLGFVIAGLLAIAVFLSKHARSVMDHVVRILSSIMLIVIIAVMFMTKPPIGDAMRNTLLPSAEMGSIFPAILTLMGGTVGGYITFAGAHRLIDGGVTGGNRMKSVQRTAVSGICIAAVFRLLLFLTILGVVSRFAGIDLMDPAKNTAIPGVPEYTGISNPAAYAFRIGAGEAAYRFCGLVILAAAVTAIIGASYTSVSFLKTFHPSIDKNENRWIIGFIAVSMIIMSVLGNAAKLLVLAGTVNGLILPVSLGICLTASKNKRIMGDEYRHPAWLFAAGIVVVLAAAYFGVTAFIQG